jgi:hypothetical protein
MKVCKVIKLHSAVKKPSKKAEKRRKKEEKYVNNNNHNYNSTYCYYNDIYCFIFTNKLSHPEIHIIRYTSNTERNLFTINEEVKCPCSRVHLQRHQRVRREGYVSVTPIESTHMYLWEWIATQNRACCLHSYKLR